MSDTVAPPATTTVATPATKSPAPSSRRWGRAATFVGGALVLLALPLYVSSFWLQIGLFAMSAAVGAIGLNILLGTAGQLSLGHSFFLAVGAYGYAWFAGDAGRAGTLDLSGLNAPPLVAFVLAVLAAGLAGVLFSPISGRLRGLYLGVATLALVYVGQHVLLNAKSVTGGFNGRRVPAMEVLGFPLADSGAAQLLVMGVPFDRLERLWYFGLIIVAIAWFLAHNLLRGRSGRALGALRDSEIAASVMGVPVARYRAAAFTVSSMYAGAAGALLGLTYERIVPDSFGIMVSVNFLAMIVIGGLGSVGGAIVGAVFVSSLPHVIGHYATHLPLVVPAGSIEQGILPVEASNYLYGAAILIVMIFAPGGLAAIPRAISARRRRRRSRGGPTSS
ncbi:branched-chain amino acid ABC transporter permease [Mumia sp. Pv 4-285]|uniref:branched-chain amino acid ABC transporter permease n=1 Tax=Mumia qirimensis TaxID=3234852 RepID=UPI00351D8FFF